MRMRMRTRGDDHKKRSGRRGDTLEVGPKTTNYYVVIHGAKGNKHGGERLCARGGVIYKTAD